MKPVIRYIIIFTVIIVTVVAVKWFLIGSYRITSDKMSDTFKTGDCVLANKLKSGDNPGRNRIVLYKSPLRRDAACPPLFIGRCIGTPGDVIQMGIDGFRVNGRLLPGAPMMTPVFRIHKDIKEQLLTTMESLRIPLREVKEDSASLTLRLSLREKELLSRNLAQVVQIEMLDEHYMGYEFVIPRKKTAVDINETSLMVCKEAIMNETDGAAVIRDGKLYIHGVERTSYFFRKDYYWILSENESNGIDSRHLGLIPSDHVVGNIWYCWYSKDISRRFKKIK
ncbi:MAG: signal peptidase I [Tannerella sp.]|jgi:signal peptidase I|nr:signal peptidase I [Tannerella sp.]